MNVKVCGKKEGESVKCCYLFGQVSEVEKVRLGLKREREEEKRRGKWLFQTFKEFVRIF
jgi:hypothetical protein